MTTKTINELEQEQELLLTAINILDTITEQENPDTNRTDDEFQYYETWATTDIKKELQAKIGEIVVTIQNLESGDTQTVVEE